MWKVLSLSRHCGQYLVTDPASGLVTASMVKSKMTSPYKSLLGLANLLLVIVVALPILIFKLAGQPYLRGFFCSDQSIAHPYIGSTVSNSVLYVVCFLVPFLAIIVVETFIRGISGPRTQTVFGRQIPVHLVAIYNLIIGYLFGAACSQTLTDICKYTIGRLRPHFLDICRPDFDQLDCGTDIRPKFITNYTCLGNLEVFPEEAERLDRIRDSHLSFCSGHASFSFQAMMFVILYLQARLMWRTKANRTLLVHLFQFVAFIFAFYTALSRISDYKHHPGDVLFGAFLGSAAQVVNVMFFLKLFQKEPLKPLNDDDEEEIPETLMIGGLPTYASSLTQVR